MNPVPTAVELAARGREYAYATDWRKGDRKSDPPVPTRWHITPLGHELMGEVMRQNAEEQIALGSREWHRPEGRDLGT